MSSPRSPKVTIEITPDLIESSKERDSLRCMVAEAVKKASLGAAFVSVDLQTIRFSDRNKGYRYTYLTPRSAQIALIEFDQGTTPEPFSFQLRGGQVTFSGSRPGQKAQRDEEKDAGHGNQKKATAVKARLIRRDGSDTDPDRSRPVPEKVGARTPPTTPFARGTTRARPPTRQLSHAPTPTPKQVATSRGRPLHPA